MTNKQAIEKLNDIRCHVKETSIEEQALVMAIEALKKAGIYGDIIYREDALMCLTGEYPADFKHDELIAKFIRRIRKLPSAQPERTCVNCGRTANNGGWYADGRTRCPIEEHYALPKDGYCHLWEKRNITDDDYPERRTDE